MSESCYMCSNAKTSVEHVPPKCVFPEIKDVSDNQNHRKELITVPACEIHNTAKSKDDEYFMMVVASYFDANGLANNQVRTKIARAWNRNPKLANTVCKNISPVLGTSNYSYEIDTGRFDSTIEHASHGIYFHSHGNKSKSPFKVLSYPLLQNAEVNTARSNILRMANELFSGLPIKGSNPEIFSFQITPEIEGKTLIRMNFYEGFVVVTSN